MGVLFLYDEAVPAGFAGSDGQCQVEVADNHSVPEIRIGPEGEGHAGFIAHFSDWKQFQRFMEEVNALERRLEGIHQPASG